MSISQSWAHFGSSRMCILNAFVILLNENFYGVEALGLAFVILGLQFSRT